MENKKTEVKKAVFMLREDKLCKMFSISEKDVRGAAKQCKVKTSNYNKAYIFYYVEPDSSFDKALRRISTKKNGVEPNVTYGIQKALTKIQSFLGYALIVALILCGILYVTLSGGNSGSHNTCEYCHKEFSDSTNLNSIARTNMCSNCAGNYKQMQSVLDN